MIGPQSNDELYAALRRTLLIRWVGLALIFGSALLLRTRLAFDFGPSLVLAAGVAGYNSLGILAGRLLRRHPRGLRALLTGLYGLDLFALSCGIWLTGGATSHMLPSLLVYLPAAIMIQNGRGFVPLLLAALVGLNAAVWFPVMGLLPQVSILPFSTGVEADPGFAVRTGLFHSMFLVLAAGLALSAVRQHQKVLDEEHELQEELQRKACTDDLTRLLNRSTFFERLHIAFAAGERNAVLMCDLDHYKQYNDAYGHQAGDALLRFLAGQLKSAVDDQGSVFRYGGDEFVVLLPGFEREEATALGEKMRTAIERCNIASGGQPPREKVTLSVGVAVSPDNASAAEELVRKADRALLQAKRWKNLVWTAQDSE